MLRHTLEQWSVGLAKRAIDLIEPAAFEESVECVVGVGGFVDSDGLGHDHLAGLFPRDFVRRVLKVWGEVVIGVLNPRWE